MSAISNGLQPHGDQMTDVRSTSSGAFATKGEEEFGGITSDEVDARGRIQKPFPDDLVLTARRRVQASGVLARLETWRREDGFDPSVGGRPAAIPAEAVIVAFFLLASEPLALHIRNVAKLLHHRISPEMRSLLGVHEPSAWLTTKNHAAGRWEENVRSTLRRQILDVMDPYPARRYEAMTMAETRQVLRAHDEVESERKNARLGEFTQRLLRMTYLEQPRDVRRAARNMDMSIDQTYIETATRRGFSRKHLDAAVEKEQRAIQQNRAINAGPVEPWAGWYPKGGERPDYRPTRGFVDVTSPEDPGAGTELAWGWTVNIASRVDASMTAIPSFPRIIVAATLSLPNIGVSEEAVKLMRAALANDSNTPGVIDADKAYFANATTERLHQPTFDLGFIPSTDYRVERLGNPRPNSQGVLLLEGEMYCPSTPEHLKTATRDVRSGAIDPDTYERRRTERRHFRVHVKEKPKPNGTYRVACPARSAAPSVVCPIIEMSEKASPDRDRPFVDEAPDILPAICRQHAITMKQSDNLRDRQAFEFGSPEWVEFHTHARNSIESTNSQIKTSSIADLEDAKRRPARGFAAAGFFTAVFLAAWNIAKIAAFLHDRKVDQIMGTPTRDKPGIRSRDGKWHNPYTKTVPKGLDFPEYI